MKNKGFTLIEVLATVVILSIIMIISYPTLNGMLKKNANEQDIVFRQNAILAAKSYFSLHNNVNTVKVSKLIEEGLLEKNESTHDYDNSVVKCTDKCQYYQSLEYSVGDKVLFHDELYYVTEESNQNKEYITLLKDDNIGESGYGNTSNYNESIIKDALDEWVSDNFDNDELTEVNNYKVRLININELENLGYEYKYNGSVFLYEKTEDTPEWLYINKPAYWTMSAIDDSSNSIWVVSESGYIVKQAAHSGKKTIRPVINVLKSSL